MQQRTPEWHSIRKGVLTASQVGSWICNDTKAAKQARESALCKLVAQRAGAWEPPIFENEAMRRGTELEGAALEEFKRATGYMVRPVGFCISKHGKFGCSPDGLIDAENSGFEGKAPVPATHVMYRRAGVLPDEYYHQVHFSMAVTGASSWHFQSYSPGFAPLRVRIERDEFTERLKAALIEFSAQLEQAWIDECKANQKR